MRGGAGGYWGLFIVADDRGAREGSGFDVGHLGVVPGADVVFAEEGVFGVVLGVDLVEEAESEVVERLLRLEVEEVVFGMPSGLEVLGEGRGRVEPGVGLGKEDEA